MNALFPIEIIKMIAECAHWADRLVRTELIDGIIVSENDYTSNFTGALRREVNARNIPDLKARIQVLNPSAEREIGADACIILQNKNYFKASVFEAKWPRLSTHVNAWDSLQASTKSSHFQSQLQKQRSNTSYAAIWEMFYFEHPFGSEFPYINEYGSSCVWHEDAFNFSRINPKSPWTDQELIELLQSKSIPIDHIIRDICFCQRGTRLSRNKEYKTAFGDGAVPHKALIISYNREIQEQTVIG